MGATDIILQLAEKNNGIVTTSMVSAAGISRGNLNYLVDMGKLEKTSRGVYILPEAWEDEFINLQSRFKRGVFSHETALFLYDLTDRTPNHYDMTFPSHYNLTSAKKENVIQKKTWNHGKMAAVRCKCNILRPLFVIS